MGEKFTSRVGFLIRNFRIAAEMTQKELADKCGLNESTIRNYELGNRYPDEATLLNIANNLGVSFYALSDPDVANIFSALHALVVSQQTHVYFYYIQKAVKFNVDFYSFCRYHVAYLRLILSESESCVTGAEMTKKNSNRATLRYYSLLLSG